MQFIQGKPQLTKIEGISNVVDISVALDWTTAMPKNVAAVTADGNLYIWNVNPRSDSLGTGDQQDKEVPVKLDLENVVSVRLNAWGWGGGAITSNGELYLWGSKYMGDDEQHSPIVETALSPYQIENIGYITSFSTISGSEAAVTKEGDLYLWGFGAKKSGRKTTPHHRTTPYRALENIQSVELTYQQDYFPPGDSYAVTYDGELWHWWGSPDVQLNQLNLPPVQSVSCGATDCAAAVTRDGNVYLWGEPDKRRQGDIPPSSPPEPVEVYTGGDAVLALPGEKYHQILTESGNLYTWKEGSVPILTLSGVKVPGKITGSMEKLQAGSGKVYQSGQFSDVDEGKWYGVQNQGTVRDAYQLGLMDGMGDGTFAPEGGLRISEALKLACALRAAYTGDQIPAAAKGKPWYGPYIHYAVSNGMMEIGEFEEYSAYATRAQMAYLFAAALPEDQLSLSDQAALPGDVADSDRYAQQIRLLYRAGVLQGEDSSSAFHGDSGITRAQAAAIISRLALNGKTA